MINRILARLSPIDLLLVGVLVGAILVGISTITVLSLGDHVPVCPSA